MKEDLVSIIIPCFNRSNLIGETLDSVINQTYTHWECLVIDDGSTDDSELVVSTYCQKDHRIQFFKRPKHKPKGANACRNYGLELCKGKFVNFYDSDDLMHPDKLMLQIKALAKSNKPYCVCQSYVFSDNVSNIIDLKSEKIISDQIFDDFLQKKIVWLTQAPIFKKEFLDINGYKFDEDLQASQEWELFTRILFNFKQYEVINQPLVYLRQHENSISGSLSQNKLWHYFLARHKIYKKYKAKLGNDNIVYLKRYFLLIYKSLLRKNCYAKAFEVWRIALLNDNTYTFRQHVLLFISLLSFVLFKKGDVFLSKVNRWDI